MDEQNLGKIYNKYYCTTTDKKVSDSILLSRWHARFLLFRALCMSIFRHRLHTFPISGTFQPLSLPFSGPVTFWNEMQMQKFKCMPIFRLTCLL